MRRPQLHHLCLSAALLSGCQPESIDEHLSTASSALTTTLTLDQNQGSGTLDLSRYSLGQGGLSSLPMIHREIGEIAALHPKTMRVFLQEYYDIYPAHNTYNWTKLDAFLTDVVATGAEPIVDIAIKPQVLYPAIDPNVTDPTDYAEWEQLISAIVTHCLDKHYGIHYWEIGNEGDFGESGGCPYKFASSGSGSNGYLTWYEHTARAVRAADPTAKVGGPAEGGLGDLTSALLPAAGSGAVPFDFWSWHSYASDPAQFASQIQQAHVKLATYPALANVQTFVSEWNIAGGAPGQNPAYVAGVVQASVQNGLSMSGFYHLRDWHASKAEFATFMTPGGAQGMASAWAGNPSFGLLGVGGDVRGTYHVFSWLHALGGTQVPVTGTNADVTAMAAKNGATMNALIWNNSGSNAYTVNLSLPSTTSGYVEVSHLNPTTQGVDVIARVPASSLPGSPIALSVAPFDVYWLTTRPISLTADSLSFVTPQNSSAAAQTVMISYNGANPTLPFTATSDAAWLQVSTLSGSGNGQVLANAVNLSSLSPGTYSATVTISRSGLDSTMYEVDLLVLDPVVQGTVFTTQYPTNLDENDNSTSYELGMKFQANQAGQITALRYFKSPGETGTHTATLWSAGTPAATATFANESAYGWQQVTLSSPVSILPNTPYVVSVGINSDYVFASQGLAAAVVNGNLTAVAGGGVFNTTKGSYPADSYQNANYFTDVVFAPSGAFTLFTNQTPGGTFVDHTAYELGTKFQSTVAGSVTSLRYYRASSETGSHTGHLWTSGGMLIATAAFPDDTTPGWHQVALSSPVALTPGTTYVVSVNINTSYVATGGGLTSPVSNGPLATVADGNNGVFTTNPSTFPQQSSGNANYFTDVVFATSNAFTLFTSQTPNGTFVDHTAYELGTKFQTNMAGSVKSLRYYRAASETGSHTGHLWTSSGTLLATAAFPTDTTPGWHEVALSSSVALTPGITYVVSYNINTSYAATSGGLASPVADGPLATVADNNGVYTTSPGTFPQLSSGNANYFADVSFATGR